MPAEFQISDEDIAYAESVLLPKGAQFDEERRSFVRCCDTVDLQAVPGSGKTTALLAKLLIFNRHLPHPNGSGVLVISHTNVAVNEIHRRIGSVCPKLFAYPNFVGTIQSFIDTFLAIPSFVNERGFRPIRIDADTYNLEISRRYQSLNPGAKNWIDRNDPNDPEGFMQCLRFDYQLNLTVGLGGRVVLKSESQSVTYKTLAGIKNSLFNKGLLHFEDVFLFAESLLRADGTVKSLLQKRFQFVFVDEMQDMDSHQHNILEALFGGSGESTTVFQRIGDTDQAIFGGTNILDTDGWHPRDPTLTLNNSLRLSPRIAKILPPFAYERRDDFEITGLQDADISPHFLIYDDDSIGSVVGRYAQLIEDLQLVGRIPMDPKGKFMVVAWNSVWSDVPDPSERKFRLIDFCPSFEKTTLRKVEFETLADYLNSIDPNDQTLGSARKGILRGVCRALSLDEVVDPRNERTFTPKSLVSYFRNEISPQTYPRLNRVLLKWSINLVGGRIEATHRQMGLFIPKLMQHFGKTCSNASGFMTAAPTVGNDVTVEQKRDPNTLRFGSLKIGLGTVHSVKGQTHTATLYIESSYYNDGGKKYESQRLAAQFKGVRLSANASKRLKESAKMVYVGFSRPTHLLVFAVHKENYEACLSGKNSTDWEVIKLYEERGNTTSAD